MLSVILLFLLLAAIFVGIIGCIVCFLFGVAKAFQPYLQDREKWEDLKAKFDKAWDDKEEAEKGIIKS